MSGDMFVKVYRVSSGWFREDKPLWTDEVDEGTVKYPWRVKLEPVKLGVVNVKELSSKLTFLKKVRMLNVVLIGTPANAGRKDKY